WIARDRAFREFGQLSIIIGWQVVPDVADRCFDDVESAEQPSASCGYRAMGLCRMRDLAEGIDEDFRVFPQSLRQGPAAACAFGHALRFSEAAGVLLQPFDAEKFSPNGLFRVRDEKILTQ